MPNPVRYPCADCKLIFDDYADYDVHRRAVHGTLVIVATPTMELRVAALERTVERLVNEMERMKEGSEP